MRVTTKGQVTIPQEVREDMGIRPAESEIEFIKDDKGSKTNVLPDFFIGAHAAVGGYTLITRGKGRFSTYFPSVNLIIPDSS